MVLVNKNKTSRSRRNYRYDLSQISKKISIEKLLSNSLWYRRRLKHYQRRMRSTTLQQSRKKSTNFHQLRLARKMQPVALLCSLHHFPDCNLDVLSNSCETTMWIDGEDVPAYSNDPPSLIEPMEYDFARPIHYEKIEIDRNYSRVDAKKLQSQLIDEYHRQSLSTSLPISFSDLVVELFDQGTLSTDKDQIVSAFYCLLNSCHKYHWYMQNNSPCDDLLIRREFSIHSPPLSYSHKLH